MFAHRPFGAGAVFFSTESNKIFNWLLTVWLKECLAAVIFCGCKGDSWLCRPYLRLRHTQTTFFGIAAVPGLNRLENLHTFFVRFGNSKEVEKVARPLGGCE